MFYAKKSYCILDPTEKSINGPWEIVFILICLREKCYMTLSSADFWLPEYFLLPAKNPSSLIFSNHYTISFLSTQDWIIGSPGIVIVMHDPKYLGLLLIWQ